MATSVGHRRARWTGTPRACIFCRQTFEGAAMPVLDTVADRQAEWSATANELKRTIDHARTMVFVLSIGGAVLAAIASQMSDPAPGLSLADNHRAWVAIMAALSLAVGTFFSQRLLGAGQVTAW